jgi:hypothetical protein
MKRVLIALLAAFALLAMTVAPAGAVSAEADNWLEINNPGATCLYAYASVNAAASVPPGQVATWSQAATVFRVPNPCNFALESAQHLSAAALGVRATLWCDNGVGSQQFSPWQSATTYNAANTGIVEVHYGSQVNPCQADPGITVRERTVVDSYVWTGITYAHYTETTHWVTR